METTAKKITSFRLSESLLDRLRSEAKKVNRSLNNYVECILMDSVYREPNQTTLEAIEEARMGKRAGTISTDSVEALIASIGE
jgi:hypothetical protein